RNGGGDHRRTCAARLRQAERAGGEQARQLALQAGRELGRLCSGDGQPMQPERLDVQRHASVSGEGVCLMQFIRAHLNSDSLKGFSILRISMRVAASKVCIEMGLSSCAAMKAALRAIL